MNGVHLDMVAQADLESVLALNEAALPAVSSVPLSALRAFMDMAEAFLVARRRERVCGFLVLLAPGADYASPNYRWFSARYPDFLYVDRVVVDAASRGCGVGRAFYQDAWRRCRARSAPLACEVNLEPPNPESLAFHRRMGFRQVGTQDTEGGRKTVSLMLRDA